MAAAWAAIALLRITTPATELYLPAAVATPEATQKAETEARLFAAWMARGQGDIELIDDQTL